MKAGDKYKTSDYWAICDECGARYRISHLKLRWDGALVCRDDWELRHPQLDLMVWPDKMNVPVVRPHRCSYGDLIMLDTLVMLNTLQMAGSCYITTAITPDDL